MPSSNFPSLRKIVFCLQFNIVTALGAALLFGAGGLTANAQTITPGSAISVSGANASGSSTVSVSGASGTVSTVQVKLSGLTSNGQSDNSVYFSSFVLAGPDNKGLVLLGATGDSTDGDDMGDSGSGLKNATITIEDGQGAAPNGSRWYPQAGPFTVEPSSYWLDENGSKPSDISGTTSYPQQDGSSTLTSTFANSGPNGTWTLYILNDDPNGDADPISITGWTLTLTYNAVVSAATTTVVASSANPQLNSSNSIKFTATVTSTSTVNAGTVTFSQGGSNLSCSQGNPVAVSNGEAQCTTTLSQGYYEIEASYNGATGFETSAGSLNEEVEQATTSPASNTFCNTGPIAIAQLTQGPIYPSVIKVSGYTAGQTVTNVEVELLDYNGSTFAQHLLVAPDGTHNLDFFDGGFNSQDNASNANLDFFDLAGQYPNSNNAPTSGNYEASDTNEYPNPDVFPAGLAPSVDTSIPQVPGTINYGYDPYAAGRGAITETFESNFNGAPANGDWALYPFEGDAESGTISGGWCVVLTPSTGHPTVTTVTSNNGDQVTGGTVTLTATVTSSGSPVTSGGTVTFLENGDPPPGTTSGNNVVTLNGSGQAPFTTTALPEGDNEIVAEYSGSASDNPSNTIFWQRIDDATSVSGSNGTYSYCNSGKVAVNAATGPFTPNPSNIFVTNLPGTVNSMSLTLDNFYTESDSIYEHESLIKGPTGAALDFFSSIGNDNTILSEGNYTFEDSAGSDVPQSNFSAGAYKPTSYNNIHSTADMFYSSSSPSTADPYYTAPTSFGYAAPRGSSTFGSTFGNTNPDGAWSLFFDTLGTDIETDANGWCVNFTVNPVTVAVDLSHQGDGTGKDFVQGETSAQITTVVAVGNSTGPTGDPLGSNNNPLKVTDILNSALTYKGFSGTGWSCTNSGQSVSCTNDNAVAQGASYPTLTLNVNVASSAPATMRNSVSVSGAGITGNSGSDTITVDQTPVLSISKSHSGNFTQGSTGQWTLTVSNTSSGSATSGTVTVADTLPTGYTLASYTSTSSLWTCGTIGSGSVNCTATPGIAGGSSSSIFLTVNVPAGSPTSVTNTAAAWGGGDTVHTSQGTAIASNTDTVTVVQVPASIVILGGNNQSATVNTMFASNLQIEVNDAAGDQIPNASVTYTVVTTGAGGTFSNSSNTITVNASSIGFATEAFTANSVAGSYTVVVQSGSASNTFYLTNTYVAIPTTVNVSAPSAAYAGAPISFTVTVYDQYSNVDTSYADTLQFTSTDAAATFPASSSTLTNGTGTFSVTLNTVGNQTITATDTTTPAFAGTSGSIAVTMPYLVVTTNGDTTTGVAANCAVQPAAGSGTGTCSLRDALTEAANLGVADISFDGTAFSASYPVAQNTITLANGTLTIPANTSITGPTSGSGYTLSNLVAVDGAGAAGVFYTASAGVTVSNLAIQNGNSEYGGGIFNDGGAVTVANSTFTNNIAYEWGGAILSYGTTTVTNSTFTGNSSEYGGGIINYGGTTSITNSTFTNNSAFQEGGGLYNNDQTTVNSSTFSGNSAVGDSGGILWGGGTNNMANTIVSGNSAPYDPDTISYDDLGGNQVSVGDINLAPIYNYGGPTQTMIPLPASPSICGGLASNLTSGVTTDQRGLPNKNTTYPGYSSTTLCVDSGAVQTNYAMAFTTQPPASVYAGATIAPAPAVRLTESGNLASVATGTVTMTDSSSVLSGTTSEGLSSGAATFPGLVLSSAATNDIFTASLVLDSPLSITAQATQGVTATAPVPAAMQSPTPGATTILGNSNVEFQWSAGVDVTNYVLFIGSAGVGSENLYSSGVTSKTTFTVENFPANGVTVYVKLGSLINGTRQYANYVYTESGTPTPATLSPSSGTLSTSQTFTWSNGTGPAEYALWLGTTGAGSSNLYNSYETTQTSATVSIPSNGVTVYGTLRQLISGTWQVSNYTFTEPGTAAPATLTPSSGTLSSSQTFTWSNGAGPAEYELWLGTTVAGSSNLYSSGRTTATSVRVSIPSNGVTVYATLLQLIDGAWQDTNYTFTEPGTSTPATLTPSSGTLSSSQTFTWSNGAGATRYELWLGTTVAGSSNLYNSGGTTATSVTVSIPSNGVTVYATLRQLIDDAWQETHYTFTEPGTPTPATLTPSSGTLSTSQTFTWSNGAGPAEYALWLGTTGAGSSNLYNSFETTQTSATVSIPSNGVTVYGTLRQLISGTWQVTRYTFTEPTPPAD